MEFPSKLGFQMKDLVTRFRGSLIEINPSLALPILRLYPGGHTCVQIILRLSHCLPTLSCGVEWNGVNEEVAPSGQWARLIN
jgi:hypothetical protein